MNAPEAAVGRTRAAELLDGDVVWFPIRHHSPACAWHVRSVIEQRRPFAVLVEGSPSFDNLIPHLVHADAHMPLAVYAYAVVSTGDGASGSYRRGCYLPLCDYSPELAALRAGAGVGARLGFADLDHDHLAGLSGPVGAHALVDEHVYEWSDALAALATELGCRDHNELWDHLVETAQLTTDELVAAVATYGAIARWGSSVQPETPTEDFDAAREAAMVARVRREVAARAAAGSTAPIVVVTGAFHTAVLPELFASTDSQLPVDTVPMPVVESGHGVVRYSFDRLDALSGYAAGMPSPGWYQDVWVATQREGATPAASRSAVHEVLRDVAGALRNQGGDGQPSTPSLVDAHAHAELLRRLRGRRSVARDDLVDAALSCFAKGEFGLDVRRALTVRMTGDRIGRLAPGTPRTPLAADFDQRALGLRLPIETSTPRRLELSIYRSDRDRQVSRFLHSLSVLRVNYAHPLQLLRWGAGVGRDVTREVWSCQLSAETDPTLAEAALWGASVSEAVASALRDRFQTLIDEQAASADLMRLVRTVLQCGEVDAVGPILAAIRARIVADPALSSVVDALAEADLLWTGLRPLDGGSLAALPAIGEQLYLAACSLLPGVVTLAVDTSDTSVQAMRSLHQVVSTCDWLSLDDSLYWDALAQVRRSPGRPRLAGAADGLSWQGGRVTDHDVRMRAVGHLGASDDESGAEYLAGLVAVAREALWQIDGLLDAIGAFLGRVDEVRFVRRLPQLRAVFAMLSPRETDRIAEQLRGTHGVRVAPRVVGLGEAALLANVHVSAMVTQQLSADGLDAWLDPSPTSPPATEPSHQSPTEVS